MSRCITANDRMPLRRWIGEAYEYTSGIVRRDIKDGNITVNGAVIRDIDAEVKDGDVVTLIGERKTVVDIPIYFRDSVAAKRRQS